MYTRNGKVLENFSHITDYLKIYINEFGRSMIIDGEVMSTSFQDLMKQVHRKENVNASDAVLNVFDMLPWQNSRQARVHWDNVGVATTSKRTSARFLVTATASPLCPGKKWILILLLAQWNSLTTTRP
jgi:hypothetical protein